jgi:hypothetical protein
MKHITRNWSKVKERKPRKCLDTIGCQTRLKRLREKCKARGYRFDTHSNICTDDSGLSDIPEGEPGDGRDIRGLGLSP